MVPFILIQDLVFASMITYATSLLAFHYFSSFNLLLAFYFQEAETLNERRSSRVRIGNSHTSVIDSETSLYSNEERRNSSRLGALLPPLIDEKECHHTVVRISENPSIVRGEPPEFRRQNSENPDIENEDRTSNKCAASKNGTWFHFNLCLGMLGFVIFWLFLMLRIYLPESYWTWSYIW